MLESIFCNVFCVELLWCGGRRMGWIQLDSMCVVAGLLYLAMLFFYDWAMISQADILLLF